MIKNILIGWGKRFGFLPSSAAEIKLADMRLKVCKKCPSAKESKVLEIINGQARYELKLFCSKCGCPCYEKSIVVSENCPADKW